MKKKIIFYSAIVLGLFVFLSALNSLLAKSDETVPKPKTIIVVSDIHIPDARGTKDGYAWFIKNRQLLLSFFDYILRRDDIDELVINGDLADQWLIPFNLYPNNQLSNDAFYRIWGKQNQDIVSKVNEVARKIKVVYVPGNHDMYFERGVFSEVFPDVVWNGQGTYDRLSAGNVAPFGMGLYSPYEGVYIEHGHRYDVYNSPDPYYNPGHILPLGYFVTRLAATNIKKNLEIYEEPLSNIYLLKQPQEKIFEIGWDVAIIALDGWDQREEKILMDIDDYFDTTNLHDAYKMYKVFDWDRLQNLYGSFSVSEAGSVLAGSGVVWLGGDYSLFAKMVYFDWGIGKIVVFGHTHKAMINNMEGNIYVNSGTFIDQQYVVKYNGQRNTGTFVEISNKNGEDKVSLWRYIGPEDQVEQIGSESIFKQ